MYQLSLSDHCEYLEVINSNIDPDFLSEKYNELVEFDKLHKLTESYKSNYEHLLFEMKRVAKSIVLNRGISGASLTDFERALFNTVNSLNQLLAQFKYSCSKIKLLEHNVYGDIIKYTNFLYDNHPGYKILTNLRNYLQHCSQAPIFFRNKGGTHTQLMLNKEVLKRDKKVKNKLKLEINSPHDFDLLALVVDFGSSVESLLNFMLYKLAIQFHPQAVDYTFEIGKINLESNLSLVLMTKSEKFTEYLPCPQKSVLEISYLVNNDGYAQLSKDIESDLFTEKLDINNDIRNFLEENCQLDTLTIQIWKNFISDAN